MDTLAGIRDRIKIVALRVLSWARQRAIGPYSTAVLARTENGLLLTPAGDLMIGRRLCFGGRYDPELVNLLLRECTDESHVLFVGAHVGALVVPVAKKARRVVAIEANPATFELLQTNVYLNGLRNVELHNCAAGNRDSEVSFLSNLLNSGGSGIALGEWKQWAYTYDAPRNERVQMKRLDDIFPNETFDLIVMDIEGAEVLALQAMPRLLSRSRMLLVEVFEDHLRRVAKVTNQEFLAPISGFYDSARILPEKPRGRQTISTRVYRKPAFPQMMQDCCTLRMANVMFWKSPALDSPTNSTNKNFGQASEHVPA